MMDFTAIITSQNAKAPRVDAMASIRITAISTLVILSKSQDGYCERISFTKM